MANNVIKRTWNQNRMVQIEDLKGMTFQAEQAGHTFQISGVDDSGETVALTGSVAGVFLRPDNTDVAFSGSVSGGVVTASLPAECYDVPGRFGLTIFVTADNQKTAVYAAIGTVSRTSSGVVAPSTTTDVVDLINRINAAVATIPASWSGLMADIAPTYSDSSLYAVGQYVYYDGDLKRCISPITTAESYTASHWTSAVLGNDVTDLKSALNSEGNNLISKVLKVGKDFDNVSWTENAYIAADGSIVQNQPGFKYSDLIALSYGDYAIYARKKSASDAAKTLRIHCYDANGVWKRQITSSSISNPPDYCYEVRFSVGIDEKIKISTNEMTDLVALVPYGSYEKTLVYRWQLTSSDDIHNLSLPGMYFIGSGSIPQNFPQINGNARVLVIKSSSGNSGEYHIFANGDKVYIENYNGSDWSPWREILTIGSDGDNNYIKYRGQLTSNDNMDEIDYPGMYFVNMSDPPANFPSEEMGVVNSGRFRVLINKSSTPNNHYGELQLISGEKNLYFRTGSSGGNLKPWRIVYGKTLDEDSDQIVSFDDISAQAIMLGLHVVPRNNGVLNAIKRARQQTDIKWTPGTDIPRGFFATGDSYVESHGDTYMGRFSEGIEYTGLPYTEEHEISTDYSMEAFATSVANDRSVMALESAGASSNHACYYGTVCTNLTSYALGIPTVTSHYWEKIPGISKIGDVNTGTAKINPKLLNLADILKIAGHCAIVTDIITDQNGTIQLIEISEATRQGNIDRNVVNGQYGGIARRVTMTIDEFYTWFAGFAVLRYAYLSTIPYAPNPYSPMPGEGNPIAYIKYPCLPYYGNKISFTNEGNRQVKILINSDNYTHLVVKKDGVEWNQNGTTDPYSISGLDEITITCDSGFAIYTAYLETISNGSVTSTTVSCSWAIRPSIDPAISISDGKINFSFTIKGDVFKPWYVAFGTSSSDTLTNVATGEFIKVFDSYTVTNNNDGTYTYIFSVDYPNTNPAYVRVGVYSDHYGSGSKALAVT